MVKTQNWKITDFYSFRSDREKRDDFIQHLYCWIQLDKMLDIACGKSGHSSALLKGKFSSGREGALASKFNYDFK